MPFVQRCEWATPAKDGRLEFGFEGQGSPAGSVSCSLQDSRDDLQFLDDLGMKFKTLAEICSPPEKALPPSPPPSLATLTQHEAGAASTSEHVDKQEAVVETRDERVETLSSSSIMSRSPDSAPPPSGNLHQSRATISHSSSISRAAALLPQPQPVLLQQQPLYYTASAVLQPVQYVVQPQLQNMVLLPDEGHGANAPGLFLVHDSKDLPPLQSSGIVTHRTEHRKKLEGQTGPTSPTVLLPARTSTGPAQSSGSVKGWKIVVPNPDRKANSVSTLVTSKIKPGVAERNPVSSQGIKKAAPAHSRQVSD